MEWEADTGYTGGVARQRKGVGVREVTFSFVCRPRSQNRLDEIINRLGGKGLANAAEVTNYQGDINRAA